MTRASVTRTRSGNLRGSVDPQALARELEAIKAEQAVVRQVLTAPMRGHMSSDVPTVDPGLWGDDPDHIAHKAWTGPEPVALQLRRLGVGHQAPMGTRGPGAYPRERVVMRQASSGGADIWAGDVEHSPGYMQAIAQGANVAELRRRSAEHALMEAVTRQPGPVIFETPVFCGADFGGPDRCRPGSPCPNCAGRRRPVTDNSVAAEPSQQTSIVHEPYGPDSPAMAQQAGRDAMLNQVEYQHAARVAAQAEADRRANAEALAEASEAIRVRQHAERMGQRLPEGEILKGPGD